MSSTEVLSRRALNRTLLARQLLLERRPLAPLDAIEHLVGLQSQAPRAPYVALWSRLEAFEPAQLEGLTEERRAVRVLALLRTTIHLTSADDALSMRAILQGAVERGWRTGSPFARQLGAIDVDELVMTGRELLLNRAMTASDLAKVLAERWPERDPMAMAMTVRYLLPLVQPTPRGLWSRSGRPTMVPLEEWLGRPMPTETAPDELVLRYLRAFGPATVADIATWSWLGGVREIVERLRPGLRSYRDERGRELLDVPEGAIEDEARPAPPRFLPEYDNVLLSHDDRSRIYGEGYVMPLAPGDGARLGTFLVDGFAAGTWRISLTTEPATLTVEPVALLAPADEAAVGEEARALAAFIAPDRDVEIRLAGPR